MKKEKILISILVFCLTLSPVYSQDQENNKEKNQENKESDKKDKKKKSDEELLHEHTDTINVILYSNDNKIIYSASADKTVRFWDTKKGEIIKNKVLKGHSESIKSMALSPSGKILATGSDDYKIKIWDLFNYKEIKTLNGHLGSVSDLLFYSDKNLVSGGYDGKIVLWDIITPKIIKTIKAHDDEIHAIALNKLNNILASGGKDKSIKIWSLKNGSLIKNISNAHYNTIESLEFDKSGNYLISSSWQELYMWDTKTGNKIREIPIKEVSKLKFNKEGNILATAGGLFDKNIKLWSFPSFKLLKKIESKSGMPSTIDFSKDGKIIVSSGDEKVVKFWDIKTGKDLFEELE